MNVLSLFDGISCAQLALKNANIKVNRYYSSEIDQKCILVTKSHFPNTIFLGDVKSVTSNLFTEKIDLLIGGSPCQNLSCAGKRNGLKGDQSILFYEYVRIRDEVKPKWFLFENVSSMKVEDREIISKYLGVKPIELNSNLVTAQNRRRLYWTNIPNIGIPKDRKITIHDIIDKTAFIVASRGRYKDGIIKQNYEPRIDGKSNTLTSVTKDNLVNICEDEVKKGEGAKRRPLTPEEYEQLQGIPIGYTNMIPKTYRYRLVANAFTVPIITHILSHIVC